MQNDLLFTSWDGSPFDLNIVTSWFPHFLRSHDLPAVTVHSLRHTYASLMIAAHVPIVTVAGRLGHAQTSTTVDIYANLIKTADAAASDVTDAILTVSKKEATHRKTAHKRHRAHFVRRLKTILSTVSLFCALFVRYSFAIAQNARKSSRKFLTMILYNLQSFEMSENDFGRIWEQEAASSSLATPI